MYVRTFLWEVGVRAPSGRNTHIQKKRGPQDTQLTTTRQAVKKKDKRKTIRTRTPTFDWVGPSSSLDLPIQCTTVESLLSQNTKPRRNEKQLPEYILEMNGYPSNAPGPGGGMGDAAAAAAMGGTRASYGMEDLPPPPPPGGMPGMSGYPSHAHHPHHHAHGAGGYHPNAMAMGNPPPPSANPMLGGRPADDDLLLSLLRERQLHQHQQHQQHQQQGMAPPHSHAAHGGGGMMPNLYGAGGGGGGGNGMYNLGGQFDLPPFHRVSTEENTNRHESNTQF